MKVNGIGKLVAFKTKEGYLGIIPPKKVELGILPEGIGIFPTLEGANIYDISAYQGAKQLDRDMRDFEEFLDFKNASLLRQKEEFGLDVELYHLNVVPIAVEMKYVEIKERIKYKCPSCETANSDLEWNLKTQNHYNLNAATLPENFGDEEVAFACPSCDCVPLGNEIIELKIES